jgi:hypothetical protein
MPAYIEVRQEGGLCKFENGWSHVKDTGCYITWGLERLRSECVLMGEMFGTAARAVDHSGLLITSCNPQMRQPSVIVTNVHYSGQDNDFHVTYKGHQYLVPECFLYGRLTSRGGYDNRAKVYCLYSFIEKELEARDHLTDMLAMAARVKRTNDSDFVPLDPQPGEIIRFRFATYTFVYFYWPMKEDSGYNNRWFWIKNAKLCYWIDGDVRKRLASLARIYTGDDSIKED